MVLGRVSVWRMILGMVVVASASLACATDSWEQIPEATRNEVQRLLTLMDDASAGGGPPHWSLREQPRVRRPREPDGTLSPSFEIAYRNFVVLLWDQNRRLRHLRHRSAYGFDAIIPVSLGMEQAVRRAEEFLAAVNPSATFEVQYRLVLGPNQYYFVYVLVERGVPHSTLHGTVIVTVDGVSGRILHYQPTWPPEPVGPTTPAISAFDAETAAGLALAERFPGSSWEIGPARLYWRSPAWWTDFHADPERYGPLSDQNQATLFYELGMRNMDTLDFLFVSVDALTGRVGGYLAFGPPRGPAKATRPHLPIGPATVVVGDARRDAHRAAVLWTRAKSSVQGQRVSLVGPGAALNLAFDPATGTLIDPDTRRVGIPTPALARVIRELTDAPR